jgi:condensin complex subunit 1
MKTRDAQDERQWRDIGYCLTQLNYSTEKMIKKLEDNLPLFKDKLYEDTLYKHFQDIVQKTMKSSKSDLKPFIEDFKEKLDSARRVSLENYQAAIDAGTKFQIPKIKLLEMKTESQKCNQDALTDEESEHEKPLDKVNEKDEDDTLSESVMVAKPKPATIKRKVKRAVKTSRMRKVIDSDSD